MFERLAAAATGGGYGSYVDRESDGPLNRASIDRRSTVEDGAAAAAAAASGPLAARKREDSIGAQKGYAEPERVAESSAAAYPLSHRIGDAVHRVAVAARGGMNAGGAMGAAAGAAAAGQREAPPAVLPDVWEENGRHVLGLDNYRYVYLDDSVGRLRSEVRQYSFYGHKVCLFVSADQAAYKPHDIFSQKMKAQREKELAERERRIPKTPMQDGGDTYWYSLASQAVVDPVGSKHFQIDIKKEPKKMKRLEGLFDQVVVEPNLNSEVPFGALGPLLRKNRGVEGVLTRGPAVTMCTQPYLEREAFKHKITFVISLLFIT